MILSQREMLCNTNFTRSNTPSKNSMYLDHNSPPSPHTAHTTPPTVPAIRPLVRPGPASHLWVDIIEKKRKKKKRKYFAHLLSSNSLIRPRRYVFGQDNLELGHSKCVTLGGATNGGGRETFVWDNNFWTVPISYGAAILWCHRPHDHTSVTWCHDCTLSDRSQSDCGQNLACQIIPMSMAARMSKL